MGVTVGLYTLSDDNIKKVIDNPLLLELVFDPEDPLAYEKARHREMPGWLGRLFGKKPPQRPDPAGFVLGADEAREYDLGKGWHGLHYLLTKSNAQGDPPLDFLLADAPGSDDTRCFNSAQVCAIDAALRPLDAEFLRSRFDPADMDRLDIYPRGWSDDPDQALDFCTYHFPGMMDFIHQAAGRRLGLLINCS